MDFWMQRFYPSIHDFREPGDRRHIGDEYVHLAQQAGGSSCRENFDTGCLKAAGEILQPAQWPRRSIDPAKWEWFPLIAHPFHQEEHINLLEVRAALLQLRWRSRTPKRLFTRFFHLLDSQVGIAI